MRRLRGEEGGAVRRIERGVRRVREMVRRLEKMVERGDAVMTVAMTVEEAEERLARVERERAQMGRVVLE